MPKAEAAHNIVQDSYNVSSFTHGQAGFIRMQGHISAIMETILNTPIRAIETG